MSRKENNHVVGVKIEKNRPEESLEIFAKLLAEAMTNAANAQADFNAYQNNAASERQKGIQIQGLIFQLQERENLGLGPVLNKYGTPSRMHPLNTYNVNDLKVQFKECRLRQIEFQRVAEHYSREMIRLNEKVVEYQRKIKDFEKNKDVQYFYFGN